MSETITEDGEIVADSTNALAALSPQGQSMLATMVRAEIDTLIATARAFPRSIKKSAAMLMSIVTLDPESAQECIYALPRGGKPIRGPSVRFAEALLVSWGNAAVEAKVIHVDRDEKVVVAEASFRDLETNTLMRSTVRRRIVDSKGRLYSDDMIIVTGNAACSIARRNVILAGVPKPIWRGSIEAVERTIAGTGQTLSVTRDSAVKAFAMYGVKPEQVFAALGVTGIEDVQLDHVITLRGMYSAIKNEEATVEEVFNMRTTGGGKSEGVTDPLGPAAPAGQGAEPKAAKEPAKPKKGKEPAAGPGADPATAAAAEGVADHQAPAAAATEAAKAPAEPAGGDQGGEPQPAAAAKEAPAPAAAAAPKAPVNEAEYEAYVLAYIEAATSSGALANDWKGDRGLRQAVNITSETMDKLKAAVTAKVNALKEAGK